MTVLDDRAHDWERLAGGGGGTPAVALAVIEPDDERRTRIAADAGPDADASSEIAALLERHPPGHRLVAVFGPGFATPDGLAAIDLVTRSRPEVGTILLVEELSTALFQEALRSGVRDVLGFPVERARLAESVDRVGRSIAGGRPAPPGEASEPGRVITVSSMKGGSGKTVVATSLAVALARRSERPVALVDADLQFGDVAIMLRLAALHTIVDVVGNVDDLDAQFVRSLLVRHDPTGLLVLPAPIDPALAERVSGSDLVHILAVLRSFCGYVVIDTPAQFNDVVLSCIEAADDIVLVAGMEIPNIKNTKLGLQTLQRLGVAESKVRLLVNRSDSKVQLDIKEVERALGLRAESLIPSDIVVPQAINRGVSVILDAPRSGVTKAFEELADLFLTGHPARAEKKARGLFGRA